MSIDVERLLRGINEQEIANSPETREGMATLHGWLAAGGTKPTWDRCPVGTARFLRNFPQYKKLVPRSDRYMRAARRILSAQEDEYTSIKDLHRIRREVEEYLRGQRQDL